MGERLYDRKYYVRGLGSFVYNPIIKLMEWFNLNGFKKYFNKNDLILEIGCGDGKVSNGLSPYGIRVDAIDISKKAIEIAKKQKSTVNFICGDVFSLKRKDNYYDAAFGLHVMEHIDNIEDSLREIYRIIKNNGKLIVRIPNNDSLEAKLAGKKWFHRDEQYHKHHWSSYEFKDVLLKAGFRKVTINFEMLEYKQVLLYSCLNSLGIKTDSYKLRLCLLPFQIVFIPLSIVLGYLFENSGTVELIAVK